MKTLLIVIGLAAGCAADIPEMSELETNVEAMPCKLEDKAAFARCAEVHGFARALDCAFDSQCGPACGARPDPAVTAQRDGPEQFCLNCHSPISTR